MEEAGWRIAPQQAARQEIDQMRETIDTLDQTIAALLSQRLLLSKQIGAAKAGGDLAVKDQAREEQVLRNVRASAGPQLGDAVASIYSRVIEESCKVQAPQVEALNSSTSSTVYFPRVLIVGLGMIGGALARQIKRAMPDASVSAVDRPDVLERALSQKLIDRAETDLTKAVPRAGLILLCAPPAENLRLLAQIAPLTKRRQVIVDVTSTKLEICEAAEELAMKADFVGGHPLFGSHKSGLDAARDVSLEGKRFCLVPTKRTGELTLRRLARWLNDLGLRVVQTNAPTHDDALARTSHTVQLLAVALGNALAQGRSDEELRALLQLSGPSLQSLSRLMASPADMWLEISSQNKEMIAGALTELIEELKGARLDVSSENGAELRARFEEAARVPRALN